MVRPETANAGTWQRSSPHFGQGTDEQPFKEFFMRYRPDIFGYLWRIIGEEQAAQDICQETFLRAWQHFGKVSAYERPGAWLFRVATNLAINYQRHRSTTNDRLLKPEEAEGSGIDPMLGIVERDAVTTALQALPARQRMALVLRVVYGMPFQEIAITLGVSQANARMALSRGRQKFRRHYLEVSCDQSGEREIGGRIDDEDRT
jgi:RNA polymerase sigma-70 factor (ECF subfamily)